MVLPTVLNWLPWISLFDALDDQNVACRGERCWMTVTNEAAAVKVLFTNYYFKRGEEGLQEFIALLPFSERLLSRRTRAQFSHSTRLSLTHAHSIITTSVSRPTSKAYISQLSTGPLCPRNSPLSLTQRASASLSPVSSPTELRPQTLCSPSPLTHSNHHHHDHLNRRPPRLPLPHPTRLLRCPDRRTP